MAKVTVIFSGTVPAAVGQDPLRPWREGFSGGEDSLEAIRVPADHPESLRAACQQALEAGSDFLLFADALLRPAPAALDIFLENDVFLRHQAILVGTVAGPDGQLLFGGRSRRGRLVQPDLTIPVPCQFFDMSCVLVPAGVFSRFRSPDDLLRRTFWDFGYGQKVAMAGVPRMVAPGILARMDHNPLVPLWQDPETPLWRRVLSYVDSLLRGALKRIRAVLH